MAEENKVDAATEAALLRWKDQIIQAIEDTIEKKINALETSIGKEYGLKMDYVEKEQERSFTYHKEHYEAIRDIHKRIDDLEARQSKDEGQESGKEKAKADSFNKQNLLWIIISVIIAGTGILIGVL